MAENLIKEEIVAAVNQMEKNNADNVVVTTAVKKLSELAENYDNVDLIMETKAVEKLVGCLKDHKLEEGAALTLGLLAKKPTSRQAIVNAGALDYLVTIIKRYDQNNPEVNDLMRRAVYAISHICNEVATGQFVVRTEGGIPPLVDMLKSWDVKLYQAAAGALRMIAFRNQSCKDMILECNALPTLLLFLQSENVAVYHEAVCVIGVLVDHSLVVTHQVLVAGALQPVIDLLSSTTLATQIQAAFLIGQFAEADAGCKPHIVRRGALTPLVEMLWSPDDKLKEMSSHALWALAIDPDNKVGIARAGAIPLLLELVNSGSELLQKRGACVLCELASSEDVLPDFIRADGLETMVLCDTLSEEAKQTVQVVILRLQAVVGVEKVLNRLLFQMRTSSKNFQYQIVLALVILCSPNDLKKVLVRNNGIKLLLELLNSIHSRIRRMSCAALLHVFETHDLLSPDHVSHIVEEHGGCDHRDDHADAVKITHRNLLGVQKDVLQQFVISDRYMRNKLPKHEKLVIVCSSHDHFKAEP